MELNFNVNRPKVDIWEEKSHVVYKRQDKVPHGVLNTEWSSHWGSHTQRAFILCDKSWNRCLCDLLPVDWFLSDEE